MLLITIFVELRVVAGRSRMRAGSPQAGSRRPCCAVGLEKNSMVKAWHGHGMANLNQTRPHYVNQMGKTRYKPLAARHGRRMAWARHAMCESAHFLKRTLGKAWKATRDRLRRPYYLSKVDHVRKIMDRKQRTDIGKNSFVNRTIKNWNQRPAEALGTLPCKPKIFRKRVRKAIINGVK